MLVAGPVGFVAGRYLGAKVGKDLAQNKGFEGSKTQKWTETLGLNNIQNKQYDFSGSDYLKDYTNRQTPVF
jgi:hypothetical protein